MPPRQSAREEQTEAIDSLAEERGEPPARKRRRRGSNGPSLTQQIGQLRGFVDAAGAQIREPPPTRRALPGTTPSPPTRRPLPGTTPPRKRRM